MSAPTASAEKGRQLIVRAPGLASTIQDLGRPGWFRVGVGVSGAADRGALQLANRLVGNPEGAAAIECLLGGLDLEATATVRIAVTGAPAPLTVDDRPQGYAAAVTVAPGQRIRLGSAATGLWTYLAVRGGIDVEPVLGSRSRDTLAGLGPEPLAAGTRLPIGGSAGAWPETEQAPIAPPDADLVVVRARLGPRADFIANPEELFADDWRIGSDTNRIGARLDGPALRRARLGELPTEGMALGAIQVPPAGIPVVFLADHPITGGYPVVATVLDADVDRIAQARPAQRIRFRPG